MKLKGLLKFKGKESKGPMHYIDYFGQKVSITKKESRKVKHIKQFGHIEVAPNLLSRSFSQQQVFVNEDVAYTKDVFNYMKEHKHSHYKKWEDDFVVLQFKK